MKNAMLIGINSCVDSGGQGLNYALSVDEAMRMMQMNGDQPADGGAGPRARHGLRL